MQTKSVLILILLSLQTIAVDWPGTGNCATTLQACIDAQSLNATITIRSNSLVMTGGNINIDKGLTLLSGSGYHPIFNNVNFNIDVPSFNNVIIRGLEFEQSSFLDVTVQANSEINILYNNWTNPDAISGRIEGIRVSAVVDTGNTSLVSIYGNNINAEGENGSLGLIHIFHPLSGHLVTNIIDNHITIFDINPSAITAINLHNGSGFMESHLLANQIRGGNNQIALNQTNPSGTQFVEIKSNLLTSVIRDNTPLSINSEFIAISSQITHGELSGMISHNTIDGFKGSSLLNGRGVDLGQHTSTDSASLQFINNIIVNTSMAFVSSPSGDLNNVLSDGNNIFNNHGTTTGLTFGLNDVVINPQFVQQGVNYGLKANSPAIDNALPARSPATNQFGLVFESPKIDADGMRRHKGSFSDSGAFEWGGKHIVHQVTNPIVNTSTIDDTAINNNPNASLMVTQIFNGVYHDHPLGVFYLNNQWQIFNEDQSSMPIDTKFHIYSPYGSSGDSTSGQINFTATTSSATGFTLDAFALNNNPGAIIFATHVWDNSTFLVNPHPLEVGYQANTFKWYLGNADGGNMLNATNINTYFQDSSRNAFYHEVNEDNTTSSGSLIDHPLLNNNPCALPLITQSVSWLTGSQFEQNPKNVGVVYNGIENKWMIFNIDLTAINLLFNNAFIFGGRFNVMVDPQQVYQCNDVIFKDGFD